MNKFFLSVISVASLVTFSHSSAFSQQQINDKTAAKISFAGKVIVGFENSMQLYRAEDVEEVSDADAVRMDQMLSSTFNANKKVRVGKYYGDFEKAKNVLAKTKAALLFTIVKNLNNDTYEVFMADLNIQGMYYYNISSYSEDINAKSMLIKSKGPNFSDLLFARTSK